MDFPLDKGSRAPVSALEFSYLLCHKLNMKLGSATQSFDRGVLKIII
jgi:hypothetical protein